ncbi:hypothetical protein LTR49_026453 [Elasticomyces elasticus]|nr:hypothetical protein LTR49_026453 [Elasticomyces elasticus]
MVPFFEKAIGQERQPTTYLHEGQNTTATSGLVGIENLTWSAELLSLHNLDANKLQYHYVVPQIANVEMGTKSTGTAVSKLITVLTGLVTLTEADWYRSITNIIPEVAIDVTNPQALVRNEVTLWMLATQLSGLQSIGVIGDGLLQIEAVALATNTSLSDLLVISSLPQLPSDILGTCDTMTARYRTGWLLHKTHHHSPPGPQQQHTAISVSCSSP